MPTTPLPAALFDVRIADAVLEWAGVILIGVFAIGLTISGRWGRTLRLPRVGGESLRGLDVAICLYGMFFFPVVLNTLLPGSVEPTATTGPATDALQSHRQAWVAVLGQAATAVFLVWMGRRRMGFTARKWGIRADRLPRDLAVAMLGYVAIWPVCAGLLDVSIAALRWGFPDYPLRQHDAIKTLISEDFLTLTGGLTLLSAVALAPFVEEMLFRGILQRALAQWSRSQWAAVVVSGVAFGCIHYPYIQTVPALACFGIVLGFAYARTRSLPLVVAMHAIFNAKTVLWVALGRT
ncbi:MAG: lysostaphin resistance A-like protein [Phycisphaerae bacterium]